MAQLTPKDILEISEPIEAIYQQTVDELLINIAHHFEISGWERTRYWEIKKLSEMGALTEESARIIAQNTGRVPEEIQKAFLQVAEKACMDIDPQLRAAAEKGILQDPGTTPTTSVLMRDSIRSYVAQAQDTLNMVNTTMLQSTREAYLRGITTAVNEAQLQETKQALETQAFNVVTGAETRTRAIRKAMNQLAATGITGFYDRAGRAWHAEAYAAMVVRTTAHNAAIEAIKTRQQEFGGGDIFQVSTHPGARPLCYPYQGLFFSWSGDGTFVDGAGQTHTYEDISQSSYGEAAGLFGINCGHHPIPMIPGFSYPQDGPTQSKEENDKEYKESQEQRQYERDIREAKRDLEIAKATGDEEAIKAAKQKVAQEQAKIREYTKETGRARRYDREQIPGGKEYEGYKGYRQMRNSDIPVTGGGKATETAKKAAEKAAQATEAAKQYQSAFTPAKDLKKAEAFAERFTDKKRFGAVGISYKGVDVEVANIVNKTVSDFFDRYNVEKFGGVIAPAGNTKLGKLLQGATAGYNPITHSLLLNRTDLKNIKTATESILENKKAVADFLANPDKYDLSKMSNLGRKVFEASKVSGRGTVPENLQEAIWHEMGHALEKPLRSLSNYDELRARMGEYAERVSGYSTTAWGEYVAESFTSYQKGELVADPLLIDAFKALERIL
ncbi:MAG: hypothetical protein J6S14_23070 [Clostridia bacterium]|nr:hypothetical protein [Clostridia bacterium]